MYITGLTIRKLFTPLILFLAVQLEMCFNLNFFKGKKKKLDKYCKLLGQYVYFFLVILLNNLE